MKSRYNLFFCIQIINPRLFRIWGYNELHKRPEIHGTPTLWEIFENINYTFNELKN